MVKKWDQRVFSFPEVQKEIATKLLKLRVTFSENVAASKDGAYSANFKFRLPGEKLDTLLVLSDSSMKNTSNEDWLKVPSLKIAHLENLQRKANKSQLPEFEDSEEEEKELNDKEKLKQVLRGGKKYRGPTEQMYNVRTLDVQEWSRLNNEEQMQLLYSISKLGGGDRVRVNA